MKYRQPHDTWASEKPSKNPSQAHLEWLENVRRARKNHREATDKESD